MAGFRLTSAAEADIDAVLTWSYEQFGPEAMRRYEALLVAAMLDAASDEGLGRTPRPELGDGVFSWHLRQSRSQDARSRVRQPRHLLLCRHDGDVIVIARVSRCLQGHDFGGQRVALSTAH